MIVESDRGLFLSAEQKRINTRTKFGYCSLKEGARWANLPLNRGLGALS